MRISDWSSDVCSSDLELTTALKAIDAAVSRGDIRIENDRLVVPKLKAAPEDERLKAIRRELFAGVGKIQLPDLLIAIDAATRFSWALLGRSPASEHELRSEEHTSELQSLMRISYAVFCLKKKTKSLTHQNTSTITHTT